MERNDAGAAFKKIWNRWKYAALVAALGVALLLIPYGGDKKSAADSTAADTDVAAADTDTERRMEEILTKIDGVGELHLMLTADTGAARQLAQNTQLSYSGATEAPDDYQRSSEVVLSGSADAPVVTQTRCPTWRGALVVCQGGGNPQVQLAVTQAVAALTGLGSDRITVVKCQ